MMQLLFSLRYQTQSRRTSPALYESLETAITSAITESGGTRGPERRAIIARFDDSALGFWLDMLTLLETIHRRLEEAAPELFGYICLLAPGLEDFGMALSYMLPSGGSGIWCASPVRRELELYADFETVPPGMARFPGWGDFSRLRSFRTRAAPPGISAPEREPVSYPERILSLLRANGARSMLIQGPRFVGKRNGIRRYCRELGGKFPPLVITFGAGGWSLCCITDALSAEVRDLIAASCGKAAAAELERLAGNVFRERFQEEYPVYAVRNTRRFLELLLASWETCAAAGEQKGRGERPILILENLNGADEAASALLISTLGRKPVKGRWLVFGAWPEDARGEAPTQPGNEPENNTLAAWRNVFSRMLRITLEDRVIQPPPLASLGRDLVEIAFALSLFRRYYPPALFPRLWTELGVNTRMISRALEMLTGPGVIESAEDPEVRFSGAELAAALPAGRREWIETLVRERILAWVKDGKFHPCFRLLEAARSLGGITGSIAPDTLILDCLRRDIINNTREGIERALAGPRFAEITGEKSAPILRYLYRTCRALNYGDEAVLREAFLEHAPEADAFPVYQAQIQANLSAFHFGFHDIAAAEEMVKKTLILSQSRRESGLLPQAYRLFSLTGIARHRLQDAIEYLGFAVENCERKGNHDELALAAFYAAGTHFLFGNISRAERLARKAEEAALFAGRLEWAGRSRFFQGRLYFETGRYREARTVFESLFEEELFSPSGNAADTANDTGSAASRRAVLNAWIYRTVVFMGKPEAPAPAGPCVDGRLFEIEAAWLGGNYAKAVALADRLSGELPGTRFVFIERPDWWSGFSQCELILFQPRDFFSRLASCYRALSLCRLGAAGISAGGGNSGGDGAKAEALETMRRVIREEGLPQTDPNDAFYYYVRYRVLEETGAVEVDMNTAISMAFKRLQSRASRIDDIETKRAWLSGNIWNSDLHQAARKHKLI
ncbi:MAG: hypothetical protein LBC88_07290 [Spirochaetaceae bacterium]|jgi:tetratricopeptide (TPR) repeat protein|nr:hypothetical protein [Spirochaetaceae bacterium]